MLKDIQFKLDSNSSVLGVGVDLFDRLSPTDFIDNYKIVSLNNYRWTKKFRKAGVRVLPLKETNPQLNLSKDNTDNIFQTKEFEQIVNKLQKPAVLVYKSTEIIEQVAKRLNFQIIANSFVLRCQFENKHLSRKLLEGLVKFPPYLSFDKSKVKCSQLFFDKMRTRFGKFVIQDTIASAGSGTFFINDYASFKYAVLKLKKLPGEKVVISRFIDGNCISIHGCITKYGILLGESYEQVVSDKALLNKEIHGEGKYCGARFGYSGRSSEIVSKIQSLTKVVGEKLKEFEYKGIFGLDVIVDPLGAIYLIEINPRVTGTTNFLAILQLAYNQTPFFLLHILELAGIEYYVEDPSILFKYKEKKQIGTYLILYNKKKENVKMKGSLRPGIYNIVGNLVEYSHFAYRFNDLREDNQILLLEIPDRDRLIKPRSKIMRILTKDRALNSKGRVNKKFSEIIKYLESQYIY